jgi:V8-like Glu-specific endopeptidase
VHGSRLTLTALVFGLGFSACALPASDEASLAEAVGTATQAIDGGYLDNDTTAVVGILALSNGGVVGSCSGTLIAPNVVLTAQHCVANISTGAGVVDCAKSTFEAAKKASSMFVTTKTSLSQNPTDYVGTKEVLIPANGSPVCGNDIAILILSKPIPETEAVPRVPRVDTPVKKGEKYYAVGYGQRGDNGPSGTRYRLDDLRTACVGAACGAPQYIADSELLGDTGICQGDSGGPAFDLQNRVFGVVSRGGAGCVSPVYGHVEPWGDWIKSVVVQATTDAGLETPEWAFGQPTDPIYNFDIGDACTQPTDCESNACLYGYCTRACTAEAKCPEGYFCGPQGYCEKPTTPDGSTSAGTGGEEPNDVVEVDSGCSLTSAPGQTKSFAWLASALVVLAASRRARRRA